MHPLFRFLPSFSRQLSTPTQLHLLSCARSLTSSPSIDPHEAEKFASLSQQWWDPSGPFSPLHRLNPARCRFIRDAVICSRRQRDFEQGSWNEAEPLLGLKALDVGCGGGILAESLARMGARVHAIDITQENVRVAEKHALRDPAIACRVHYECISAEALVDRGDRYDLVISSEVIEHVKRPDLFVSVLSNLMRPVNEALPPSPSPLLVLSTINRTIESYAVAIVGAEILTGLVPKGTHNWEKFITPQELTLAANQVGLKLDMLAGMGLSSANGGGLLELTSNVSVNFIASFANKK